MRTISSALEYAYTKRKYEEDNPYKAYSKCYKILNTSCLPKRADPDQSDRGLPFAIPASIL